MKADALTEIDRELTTRVAVPQLIGVRELADLMHVTTRQVYRMVHAGTFPKPIGHLGRYSRWRSSDYVAWVEQLQAKQANKGRQRR